jgi:hypothetical protein
MMWKYDFLSPPPYRTMLLVIELKLCSTMLAITVNIVLKGGGGGGTISWWYEFANFIDKYASLNIFCEGLQLNLIQSKSY